MNEFAIRTGTVLKSQFRTYTAKSGSKAGEKTGKVVMSVLNSFGNIDVIFTHPRAINDVASMNLNVNAVAYFIGVTVVYDHSVVKKGEPFKFSRDAQEVNVAESDLVIDNLMSIQMSTETRAHLGTSCESLVEQEDWDVVLNDNVEHDPHDEDDVVGEIRAAMEDATTATACKAIIGDFELFDGFADEFADMTKAVDIKKKMETILVEYEANNPF